MPMHNFLIIFVVAVVASTSTAAAARPDLNAPNGFVVTISPMMRVVQLGDPVPVKVTVTNTTTSPMTLLEPKFNGDKRFIVVNQADGNSLTAYIDGAEEMVGPYALAPETLEAGGSRTSLLDVSHFVHFRRAGTYQVQLVISHAAQTDSHSGPFTARSNIIAITLTP